MSAPWPSGFERLPRDAWTQAPIEAFARDYDALQHHTWYRNLDPTVEAVAPWLDEGAVVIDYSGGTGILAERLIAARPTARFGLVNVDASAKFLALAAGKFRDEPRCAFRLLQFRKAEQRMQRLAEVAPDLVGRVTGIVCANAIHLYPDPAEAMASWHAVLRDGGRLHIQSGNIDAPGDDGGRAWIIDRTVDAVDERARAIVAREARYAAYRPVLADKARMAAYDQLRHRYFLPVRPLAAYREMLQATGFRLDSVRSRDVAVRLDEWTRFLSVYHEGILPWVGGAEKVDGQPAPDAAVQDRLVLLAEALRDAIGGPSFAAQWTYIDATKT